MKLFESTVKFNTSELLESFVSLAKHHGLNSKHSHMTLPIFWYEYAPSFNMGRQTGQTDAALTYCENNPQSLLVTRNLQEGIRLGFKSPQMKGRISSKDGAQNLMKRHRGCRELVYDTILFDGCSRKEVADFLAVIQQNAAFFRIFDIKAVVIVQQE